jgi:hypothetical protein
MLARFGRETQFAAVVERNGAAEQAALFYFGVPSMFDS